jgi:hypothetical protein
MPTKHHPIEGPARTAHDDLDSSQSSPSPEMVWENEGGHLLTPRDGREVTGPGRAVPAPRRPRSAD